MFYSSDHVTWWFSDIGHQAGSDIGGVGRQEVGSRLALAVVKNAWEAQKHSRQEGEVLS